MAVPNIDSNPTPHTDKRLSEETLGFSYKFLQTLPDEYKKIIRKLSEVSSGLREYISDLIKSLSLDDNPPDYFENFSSQEYIYDHVIGWLSNQFSLIHPNTDEYLNKPISPKKCYDDFVVFLDGSSIPTEDYFKRQNDYILVKIAAIRVTFLW